MRLEQSFTVPVPVDEAWRVLLDLPRIAPCLPGATVTDVDGDTFTGTVKVRLGPITLTYQGQGSFVERDEAARRMVVQARGKDVRAAGAAATVTAVLAEAADADSTTVDVVTELTVTGRPAQFGRGMISEVSGKLLGQFADCLAGQLAAGDAPGDAADPTVDPTADPTVDLSDDPGGESTSGPSTDPTADPTVDPTADPTGGLDGGASTAEPAESARPAGPRLGGTRPFTAPPAEAEPVDLLRLAGGSSVARRLAWGGVGAVTGFALIWYVLRRLRR